MAYAQDEAPLPPPELSVEEEGAQQRARLHFQSGASYYEAGSYEDALREWNRAYQLSNRSELLYNLSLAHQGLNQLSEAVDYLRRFLAEVHDIPNRANLELRVQNLDRRIANQASSGASDPAPMEPPGDPQPLAETSSDGSSGPASSGTEAPAQASSEPGAYVSPGAIGGFIGAGAGVVMLAIFGSLTLAEDGRLSDLCGSGMCAQGTADDLRTFALLTDIGLGVTVAGAAVGLIFLLTDTGPGDTDTALLPWFREDGGGLVAGGRF